MNRGQPTHAFKVRLRAAHSILLEHVSRPAVGILPHRERRYSSQRRNSTEIMAGEPHSRALGRTA